MNLRLLLDNWRELVVPLSVFVASLVAGLWVRKVVALAFGRWAKQTQFQGKEIVGRTVRRHSLWWCFLLSAFLSLEFSSLPEAGKSPAGKGLGSLFLLSLMLVSINLIERLLRFYAGKLPLSPPMVSVMGNAGKIVVLSVGALTLLDIWGVPTTPLLLVVGAGVLAAALALRQTMPNLLSGWQITSGSLIKVGDYIKLESGEEGYVTELTWRHAELEGLDESRIFIPHSKLLSSVVINYGRPVKKAKEPFRFYTRAHLKELTGLKARNLRELCDILKQVPDAVVYYHTHHFIEEHQYLTPEPPNDFAIWVSDVVGEESLGERLASVDTFIFPSLGALRERLVNLIEQHLVQNPDSRNTPEGREFYFLKSISLVLPTPYVAHDLREFVEALRKVSIGSLYFHIFESRLRLQRGLNDFSIWMEDSLGDEELAREIALLDPYTYTLEGLRTSLIQLLEKRIK